MWKEILLLCLFILFDLKKITMYVYCFYNFLGQVPILVNKDPEDISTVRSASFFLSNNISYPFLKVIPWSPKGTVYIYKCTLFYVYRASSHLLCSETRKAYQGK